MKTIRQVSCGALVLAIAYLLKAYYSQASSEDLAWIIGPTAVLAEMFSTLSFLHEPGYGWVDMQHNVVIAPVCAGVNFLIIAFCMSSYQIIWNKNTLQEAIPDVMLAFVASYLLTVVVNAARIILSLLLFSLDIYSGWFTPEMVHRIAGIAVYYLFLCFFSGAVSYFSRTVNSSGVGMIGLLSRLAMLLAPLFWYLLFSLGVPFANNSLQNNPELFTTHALTVGAVTAVMTVSFYTVPQLLLSARRKMQGDSRDDSARKLLVNE